MPAWLAGAQPTSGVPSNRGAGIGAGQALWCHGNTEEDGEVSGESYISGLGPHGTGDGVAMAKDTSVDSLQGVTVPGSKLGSSVLATVSGDDGDGPGRKEDSSGWSTETCRDVGVLWHMGVEQLEADGEPGWVEE